jgi:cytochrome c556
MKHFLSIGLVVGVLAVGAFAANNVQADAAADAKYRQTVMKTLGGHMGAIGQILKVGMPAGHLAGHTAAIKAISLMAPDIFPAGSGGGKSNAKPEIWSKPGDFKMAIANFQKAAANIAEAGMSADRAKVGAAMKALGGACGGCHKAFRVKKE